MPTGPSRRSLAGLQSRALASLLGGISLLGVATGCPGIRWSGKRR